MKAKEPETEKSVDSLGQENPALDLERENIKKAQERTEKAEKEAKKADEK